MSDPFGRVTVAAVQAAPVVLDRGATLAKLDRLVDEAAARTTGAPTPSGS